MSHARVLPIEDIIADYEAVTPVKPNKSQGARWVKFKFQERNFVAAVEGTIHGGVRAPEDRGDMKPSFTVADATDLGQDLVLLMEHCEGSVVPLVEAAPSGDGYSNRNKTVSGWHTTVYSANAEVNGEKVGGQPHANPYVRLSLEVPGCTSSKYPTKFYDETKPYLRIPGDPNSLAYREYAVQGAPVNADNVHEVLTRGSTFSANLDFEITLSNFGIGIHANVRSIIVNTSLDGDDSVSAAVGLSDAKREAAMKLIATQGAAPEAAPEAAPDAPADDPAAEAAAEVDPAEVDALTRALKGEA